MDKKNILIIEDKNIKDITSMLSKDIVINILEELSKKSLTQTEISKKFELPISTTHYYINKLKKCKIISIKEQTYSSKGKIVPHYYMEKKLIIFNPLPKKSISDVFKEIMPSFIITIIGSFSIFLWLKSTIINDKIMESADTSIMFATKEVSIQTINSGINWAIYLPLFWFIMGCFIIILSQFIFKLTSKK